MPTEHLTIPKCAELFTRLCDGEGRPDWIKQERVKFPEFMDTKKKVEYCSSLFHLDGFDIEVYVINSMKKPRLMGVGIYSPGKDTGMVFRTGGIHPLVELGITPEVGARKFLIRAHQDAINREELLEAEQGRAQLARAPNGEQAQAC